MNGLTRTRLLLLAATMVGTTSAATRADDGFTPAAIVAVPAERIDATYQWSITLPTQANEQRAYLWIQPKCAYVRGVVVGLQNMLEKCRFQNGDFRDACADSGLAILYIAPGSTTIEKDKEPPLSLALRDPKAGLAELNATLKKLADLSGYDELAGAPLVPVAPSAATPFGYGIAAVATDRCIGFIPYKGWFSGVRGGLPILHVSSEWAEVGSANWGQTWADRDRPSLLKLRAGKDEPMMGEYAEIGNGHFAWQPSSSKIIGLFLKKIVAARVSEHGGPLRPIRNRKRRARHRRRPGHRPLQVLAMQGLSRRQEGRLLVRRCGHGPDHQRLYAAAPGQEAAGRRRAYQGQARAAAQGRPWRT